ncbi:MAG TPA: extracellular solute-binding protein [Chloroflexota bacterium]|nr:extracellular solute-binding protein [Chloroflexota bacterium]
MRTPGKLLPALSATLLAIAAACGDASSAPASQPASNGPAQSNSAAAPASATSGDWQSQWNALIAAAKKEGQVAIYGPPGENYRTMLADAFQKAFPGITVNYTAGGPTLAPRIITERQAGKYIPDLDVNGTTTAFSVLEPAGALDPIGNLLIRPDVTDSGKWFGQKLWYADDAQQYMIMFQGSVSPIIAVNTKLVDPKSIHSYWDPLQPQFKGKIESSDIRSPGPGGGLSRFVYSTDGLGEPFLRKLFGDMNIVLSSDQRQLADWLAQGKYSVSFFVTPEEIDNAIKQGLPLGYPDTLGLKEGFPVTAGFGAVAVMNKRPHPNAAQLYLNWLLSPDGQQAYQKILGLNSLRMDIPKDSVAPETKIPSDVDPNKVFFVSLQKYEKVELTAVQKIVTEAVGSK